MAPAVADAQRQFGADVQFIGIAGQDTDEAVATFVDQYGLGEFEHVSDRSGAIWQAFGVNAQPAYVFINDDGTIARQIGAMSDEQFIGALTDMISS